MSYNTMKTDFKNILDRDDCTDALADTFLKQGISRVQRVVRLPSMERALLITPTDYAMLQFPVPADLLQIIDVMVPAEGGEAARMKALKKLSYRRLMSLNTSAQPFGYSRFQTQVYLRGAIPIGTQLQFLYYGNFSPFPDGDSDNELSASFPDLGVYAALKYAADHFEHPLSAQWETTFQAIKSEVIQMGIDLEMEGGVSEVESLYYDDED